MQRWKYGPAAATAVALAFTLTSPAMVRAAPPVEAASEAVVVESDDVRALVAPCLLYTSPSPRDS